MYISLHVKKPLFFSGENIQVSLLYAKTYVHLGQHLTEFFSEMTAFSHKVCRKNQNTCLIQNFFPRKLCPSRDNVRKYGRDGQVTDGKVKWCMHFACWINKEVSMHSEYVILIALPRQELLCESASVLRRCNAYCLNCTSSVPNTDLFICLNIIPCNWTRIRIN